ncbi:MAG: trypsin-like serine protease [Planctomycetota bacterium]
MLLAVAASAQDEGFCPRNYTLLGGSCYQFATRLATYEEARAACARAAGGRLARIGDEEEQQHVANWIERFGFTLQSYYIALRYHPDSGRFRWDDDGSPLAYEAWDRDFPERESARRCVAMSNEQRFAWRNLLCASLNLYVCEHSPLRRVPMAAVSDAVDQIRFANTFCVGRFGYFAHPHDCRRYVLCIGGKTHEFDCVHGKFFDPARGMCSATSPCGTTTTAPTTTTTTATTTTTRTRNTPAAPQYAAPPGSAPVYDTSQLECPEDEEDGGGEWIKLRDQCYRVRRGTIATWERAQEECRTRHNATLAVIKSDDQQHFLANLMFTYSARGNPPAYWIGLNDRRRDGEFVWSDGSALRGGDYERWSSRAKLRQQRFRACVAVSRLYDMRWIDQACSREYGAVCQLPAVPRRHKRRAPCEECRHDAAGNRAPVALAVVGGEAAGERYGWYASLKNSAGSPVCGASLIDSCWLLTAAHCVDAQRGAPSKAGIATFAALGDVERLRVDSGERNLTFAQVVIHPGYEGSNPPRNDLALIRLETCQPDATPMCLAARPAEVNGTACRIVGLGSTSGERETPADRLQEARVPVMAQAECARSYRKKGWHRSMVTSRMMCAGFASGGTDACTGDSGGPLFCPLKAQPSRLVQIAITSWGFGCASPGFPGVYTRIGPYIEWIRDTTDVDL